MDSCLPHFPARLTLAPASLSDTPDSGLVKAKKSSRLRSSERDNRERHMDTRRVTRRSLAALVAIPLGPFLSPTFAADIAPDADGGPRLAIEGFDIVAY